MNEPHPTHLRAFLAVVEFGSYTKAAHALGYTEPAVHQQVRALERMLDLKLVRRGDAGVIPTVQGAKVQPHVREVCDALTALEQFAHSLQASETVIVAAGRRTASALLIPLLEKYADEFPGFDIDLVVPSPDEMIERMIQGTVDLCVAGRLRARVTSEMRREHRLVLAPWRKIDEWVIVKKAGALVRTEKTFAPSYYPIDERTNERLREHLPRGTRFVFTESDEAVRGAALAGLGLALVPIGVVSASLAAGELELVASEGTASQVCYLLHKRAAMLSPRTAHFVKFLARHRFDAL